MLTFKELTIFFVQIEVILNSPPFCPISSGPNDLSAFTPGHSLLLEPITAVPNLDLSNGNVNQLNRWLFIQAFQQNFWSRWKHEYLNSLKQRAKWTKDSKLLQMGSHLLPSAKAIARIAKKSHHSIRDQIIPLIKLCPLPIED